MDSSTSIPEWEILNIIAGLLTEADTNLKITESYNLIIKPSPDKISPEFEFMRLSANNCFNQSINLLHTILYGYKS
jgi:hypothetical protein